MAKLEDLQNYLDYQFSSGCYTGEDYKTFQTKYINYLRTLCKKNEWQLVNIGRNHYCFTVYITNDKNKYVYLSVGDVRGGSNEWYYHILVRTAANEKDYHGGRNNYCSLPYLPIKVFELLNTEHRRFI